MPDILPGREVIFEIRRFGQAMRVSAMDVKTMTEIIISTPPGPEEYMRTLALKRLEFVMKKKGLIS